MKVRQVGAMGWWRRDRGREPAERLYAVLVSQARRPEFYVALGVPDTVDGRFELVALHIFLVLRRLRGEAGAAAIAQALVDLFVEDMDASLREMGAGDLGVGRRVRHMAEALYGRIAAYDAVAASDQQTAVAALRRNLFGTVPEPGPEAVALRAMTAYVRREQAALAAMPTDRLVAGRVDFGSPPSAGGR
jgi:cytochrome b pre-mRNA-processing protein 3